MDSQPERIVLRIPKDHPQASKLLQLAEHLASVEEHESGLHIHRKPPFSPAESEHLFLELLGTAIGYDKVATIRDRMVLLVDEHRRLQLQKELFRRVFGEERLDVDDALPRLLESR